MNKREVEHDRCNTEVIENCCEDEMKHFMEYMTSVDLGRHKKIVEEYMRVIYSLYAKILRRHNRLLNKLIEQVPDGEFVRKDKLPSDS